MLINHEVAFHWSVWVLLLLCFLGPMLWKSVLLYIAVSSKWSKDLTDMLK